MLEILDYPIIRYSKDSIRFGDLQGAIHPGRLISVYVF